MLGQRNIFRRRAKRAAIALAVEQPDALTEFQPRHAVADLVDNPGAVAVRDHARIFHRTIAAAAAADIGGLDAGSFQADTHFAGARNRRRHLTIGENLRRRPRALVPGRSHSVPGNAPPSSKIFCPVMKPDLSAQRNAQARPNSSGSPKRPAGFCLVRSAICCSNVIPRFAASALAVLRRRSVRNGPGNRPLIVTLLITVLRDRPAMKPVRPARAPLERPRISIGAFTAAEVMLTMRPNLRAIMPSTVALISSIGVSMLASIALIQSSRVQLRKSPGGGPPALLMRISGSGQALSTCSRPAGVVMSPTISVTVMPGFFFRISSAVAFSASAPRAVSVPCTPSLASAIAQARPSPLLEAQMMARRPLIPRSTVSLP